MSNFRMLSKLARPLQLVLSALTFSLGAGIARYLGHSVNLASFSLGLLAVLAIQTAAFWLVDYFRLPFTPLAKEETLRNREALRLSLFQAAFATLTGFGIIVVTMFIARMLNVSIAVIVGLIVILLVSYAVPPLHLSDTGYGELVQAVALGTLFPAFSFFLQFGEFHRLLAFATFPLTLLALAYLLVNDFPDFITDQKFGRHSMLTRLTWQRAIPIHHVLVLISFLFFALTPLLGVPWGLVWPVFLVLPFALIEIIWLQRIAQGGRTLWRFLVPLSASVFGLTVYLLGLTFWIR